MEGAGKIIEGNREEKVGNSRVVLKEKETKVKKEGGEVTTDWTKVGFSSIRRETTVVRKVWGSFVCKRGETRVVMKGDHLFFLKKKG